MNILENLNDQLKCGALFVFILHMSLYYFVSRYNDFNDFVVFGLPWIVIEFISDMNMDIFQEAKDEI